MKTQKQLGKVHLKINGLDKERFKKLIESHEVGGISIDMMIKNKDGYFENYVNHWYHRSNNPAPYSRLITLDELEQLLGVKKERTAKEIQAEIDKLQAELSELTKVKAGDVVISGKGHIFRCEGYDDSTQQALIGHIWYWDCTKIDPNKTVKEVLGL